MFNIIDVPFDMKFVITPTSWGIKNAAGKYIFKGKGNTERLKSNYGYYLCQHKQDGHFCLFVDPIINIPYYLPIKQL